MPGENLGGFLGWGHYGGVVPSRDLDNWAKKNQAPCPSIEWPLQYAQQKYQNVDVIFYELKSDFVLDLTSSKINNLYRQFSNIFDSKLSGVGVYIAPDEEFFRFRTHVKTEVFRLLVQWGSGIPIHAVCGLFRDLSESSDRQVIPLRPSEICVTDTSKLTAVNPDTIQTPYQMPVFADYSRAAAHAVSTLQSMTDGRFVSLLMSGLRTRGIGSATERILPSNCIELICMEGVEPGYHQLVATHLGSMAKKEALQYTETLFVPRANPVTSMRQLLDRLVRERASTILVNSTQDRDLMHLASALSAAGLPCLELVENGVVDRFLNSRGDRLVAHVCFKQPANPEVRQRLGGVLLGFISTGWTKNLRRPSYSQEGQLAAVRYRKDKVVCLNANDANTRQDKELQDKDWRIINKMLNRAEANDDQPDLFDLP